MAKRLAKRFPCLAEFTLAVLEGKWKSAILCSLIEHPCRYADLRKYLPGLSDKVLSERLRHLVAEGLVDVQRAAGSGRVQVYALTPLGMSLEVVLRVLSSWGGQHVEVFGVHVSAITTTSARLRGNDHRCGDSAGAG